MVKTRHEQAAGVTQLPGRDDPDGELVRRAKAGELASFEELTERYERQVYSIALRIVRNEHDAEDVTQQTFLSVIEHLGKFRGESSFATWLFRIASYAALKILRARKGRETISFDGSADSENGGTVALPEFIADWRESPETLAERNETRRLLDEAMAKLDERHRLVFLLRDVEGLSIKETADALGLSEANVKIRLLRARLQLRELLTREFGDETRQIGRGH